MVNWYSWKLLSFPVAGDMTTSIAFSAIVRNLLCSALANPRSLSLSSSPSPCLCLTDIPVRAGRLLNDVLLANLTEILYGCTLFCSQTELKLIYFV